MATLDQAVREDLRDNLRRLLAAHPPEADARGNLSRTGEINPAFWSDFVELGMISVGVDEAFGGGGELADAAAIVEELGAHVAGGTYLSSSVIAAVIDRYGSPQLRSDVLPGLADGTISAGLALNTTVQASDGSFTGDAGALVNSGAQLLLTRSDDDLVLIRSASAGVKEEGAHGVDASRPVAHLRLEQAQPIPSGVLHGAVRYGLAVLRTLAAAEAVGGMKTCVKLAVEYAKVRKQFGRTIGTFQAVKHHCANMHVDTTLADAALWDALRATGEEDSQFELAASVAASTATGRYVTVAQTLIQVLGGIGFTWEHDAHLFLRRAIALEAIVRLGETQRDLVDLLVSGVTRNHTIGIPAEAEAERPAIAAELDEVLGYTEQQRLPALVERGLTMPHWPKPWGRAATAGEQLVISEEMASRGIETPNYGITSWVVATIVQHGTAEQRDRWVLPALRRDEIWCQMFSEPGAGSDAAAVSTRAERVAGGWLVNGQKVWTSRALDAKYGLATVRTNPTAAKHAGITTMVIPTTADGVDIRPLKQINGESAFNEIFFTNVFVPDENVVGDIDNGWKVARSTLGNERVSIGGGRGINVATTSDYIQRFEQAGQPPSYKADVAALISRIEASVLVNLRMAARAVANEEPSSEGNLTKLVNAECVQAGADLFRRLSAPDDRLLGTPGSIGAIAAFDTLNARRSSIAGGTSEITRNQIAERILGLPRDPLIA